jgi:hypothetical protein
MLRTYAEARTWIERYATGDFKLLFIIGRPGLAKSQMAKQALGERPHAYFECHATKLAFYCKLFEHRDQPVVIDDENSLVKDPGKLALVNCLCQTNPVKTLRWDSTTKILEERGVPAEFDTASPVLVITNHLRNISAQVTAMLDRGQPLLFEPPGEEIHREAANWFTDKEIYAFIGDCLALIPDLSMRDYVKALEIKKAGLDWKELLKQQWRCGKLSRVLELVRDSSFASEEERVRAFAGAGGSRATYFRCVAKLKRLGVWPCRAA